MTHLLRAESVCLQRGGQLVLDKIDLELHAQDFVTLVGPNGAGKTQLLRILLGILRPDSGTVWRTPDLRIGYMPQNFMPPNSLPITVKQFLMLNKTSPQDEDLHAVIEATKLIPLLERPLYALSGGERQYVLLARALLGKPSLLILDEPAQNLDINSQIHFYQLVERLYRQQKFGVLMVSHDLHLVMAASEKVLCLYQHICCSGPPQAVAQDPHFIALFGKDMAQRLAVYPHKGHDHSHNLQA